MEPTSERERDLRPTNRADGFEPIDEQYEYGLYEPPRGYAPIQPEPGWRSLLRKLWAPVAALGALLLKFGGFALKFKFLLSMLASAAVYIWIGGWWFGIGLVVLLFVHEMGHVLEAKRQGLPVSAPFFIPFLGAAIQMRRMPQDAWHEALIGIAGPILGSLGAGAVWAAGEALDSRPLVALAFLGFFLNLFNLAPVVPLDGGRIVAAIHPSLWFVGLVALVVLMFVWPNPILLLILLFSATELWQRWRMRGAAGPNPAYYRVTPRQRLTMAALYFTLAAFLVVGMDLTHVPRDF
jgi:Zn-dependent protease